jgi:hypothetical protein
VLSNYNNFYIHECLLFCDWPYISILLPVLILGSTLTWTGTPLSFDFQFGLVHGSINRNEEWEGISRIYTLLFLCHCVIGSSCIPLLWPSFPLGKSGQTSHGHSFHWVPETNKQNTIIYFLSLIGGNCFLVLLIPGYFTTPCWYSLSYISCKNHNWCTNCAVPQRY